MRLPRLIATSFVVLLAACATMQRGPSDALLRPAEDTPASFTTPDGVTPVDGCRTMVVDPRDRTTLRLARSAQYGMSFRGDYEVADGRYGVRAGELLRIDCTTGEAIGIVRQ
jgi:hypothetical protein